MVHESLSSIPVEAFTGHRILAIAIPLSNPLIGVFVAGIATWTDGGLRVQFDGEGSPLLLNGTRETLRGFPVETLARVILPAHRRAVLALAAGVDACVVAFVEKPPLDGLQILDAFYGLARNDNTGAAFLMRGDDEDLD